MGVGLHTSHVMLGLYGTWSGSSCGITVSRPSSNASCTSVARHHTFRRVSVEFPEPKAADFRASVAASPRNSAMNFQKSLPVSLRTLNGIMWEKWTTPRRLVSRHERLSRSAQRSRTMVDRVDELDFARASGDGAGSVAGGAGATGFLDLWAPPPPRARKALRPESMVLASSASSSGVVSGDATRMIKGLVGEGGGARWVLMTVSRDPKLRRMDWVRCEWRDSIRAIARS